MSYIAIAKSGDLVGMANKGEIVSMEIGSPYTLKAFKAFNRINKIYNELAMINCDAGFSDETSDAFFAVSKLFSAASEKLRAIYGEDEWSKWAARTSWIIKKK